MSLYKLKYLYKNGKPVLKHGKPVTKYARGKYTIEEIDALIADGYIPVATADELDGLRHSSLRVMGSGTIWAGLYYTGLDKKYVQVGDINADAIANFEPIGNTFSGNNINFEGIYNGNGLNISEVTIINVRAGIWGFNRGEILNINFNNITISGTGFIGVVSSINVGVIENIKIFNSAITQTSVGSEPSGGVSGLNFEGGIIKNIISYADVTGVLYAGGICGENSATIKYVKNYGNVTIISGTSTTHFAGGIVSYNRYDSIGGLIEYAENYGDITANAGGAAGVCGRNEWAGILRKISNHGNVSIQTSGNDRVGGIAGVNFRAGSLIEDAYNTGDVNGYTQAGGISGTNTTSAIIRNSYNIGIVYNSGATIGGAVGNNDATIQNVYYDSQTSGQFDTGKGEPRTTIQLQQGTQDSFILPAGGIDPDSLAANAVYTGWSTAIWTFDPKNKYPRLK